MLRELTQEEAAQAPFHGAPGLRVVGLAAHGHGVDLAVEVRPHRHLRLTGFPDHGALITCPERPGEGVFVRGDAEPELAAWVDAWFAWQEEDAVAEAQELLDADLGAHDAEAPEAGVVTGAPMILEEAILNGFPPDDAARQALGEDAAGLTLILMVGVSYE